MEFISGEEAAAQVDNESINLMLYGAPGLEKTTDACRLATRDGVCRAMYAACEPGGLKAVRARGLPLPTTTTKLVMTYADLAEVCVHAGNNRDRFDFVIVDTFTAWNANMVKAMEASKPKNGWQAWAGLKTALGDIRDGCRALGIHIIYIAHDDQPSVDDKGIFWPGGPAMSPKKAVKAFVGGIDTILRVDRIRVGLDSKRVYYTGGNNWPAAYGLPPNDLYAWYTKNRDGVGDAVVPADLKAYLQMRQPPYQGL